MPSTSPLLCLLVLWLPVAAGCMGTVGRTFVEKNVRPQHFKFKVIVDHTSGGAGGWRAACLHLLLKRSTGEAYVCPVSVEMPLATWKGPLSEVSARSRAARCANLAAEVAFGSTTAETPLGLARIAFREAYNEILLRGQPGSRVTQLCHPSTEPVTAP